LLAYPWLASRLPGRIAAQLPQALGAAGSIDPLNGDFVPAIEIDVPMQLGRFLAHSNALTLGTLSGMEAELQAGSLARVPLSGVELHSNYGFIYLKDRSLTPAARSYMEEVRSVEQQIAEREAMLSAQL
jgi:DNA-binding transcriptional LysR family regulator